MVTIFQLDGRLGPTMILSAPPLLSGREYLYFFLLTFFLLLISIAAEFYHYAKLTQFDDAVIETTVLKHYTKAKEGKAYDVLQLLSGDGARFYITSKPVLKNLVGYRVTTWLYTAHIGFYDYLKGFAAKGRIVSVERKKEKRYGMGDALKESHANRETAQLYGALFLALPLESALQDRFSYLGVSHLLAISGFHLGVLSLMLFALLRWPYQLLQQHYFPYRHRNRDLFVIAAFVLGSYLFFLGDVASLLRAYVMLAVGYLLHDRGIKIVSMQTLFITLMLLLSLWPRLFFSVGLWLSVGGVYFIFLYLRYFSEFSRYVTLAAVPVWVYMMMTPIALAVFGNYSLYHPLSVVWSILFTLFYPSALLLHAIGYGAAMDGLLDFFLVNEINGIHFELPLYWLAPYVLLALSALYSKKMLYLLLLVASGVSVAAVYQVA